MHDNQEPEIIVCQKNTAAQLIYQNTTSKEICGDLVGQTCGKCAPPKIVDKPTNDLVQLHDKTYARLSMPNQDSRLTILAPIDNTKPDLDTLRTTCNLSQRELEIARLILDGHTNEHILQQLIISKPTLKTHLRHLYQKAPEIKTFREHLL